MKVMNFSQFHYILHTQCAQISIDAFSRPTNLILTLNLKIETYVMQFKIHLKTNLTIIFVLWMCQLFNIQVSNLNYAQ